MSLTPIRMAFGPITDISGFSYRDGYTYVRALEELRKKLNELIAAYRTIGQRFVAVQGEWDAAFLAWQEQAGTILVEAAEMIQMLEELRDELTPFQTTTTDYRTI